VLPFANLSSDPEQQYFADGVTDDLTTDLARIEHMLVISRNTAFTYRDKPVDAKQIGRDLGVRYVLEGSVRRSGSQVRVNAQLIDATTDTHLWAGRFNRDTGDLLALQNDITRRIAIALNATLITAEAARPTERPDALDYILRGRAAELNPPTADVHTKAIGMFERALSVDPSSAEAQTRLAGANRPGTQWHKLIQRDRHCSCGSADWRSAGGVAQKRARALRQSPNTESAASVRGGHPRI
jgi:TolB-like protein